MTGYLTQYVVYERPADYPEHAFIVRCWRIDGRGVHPGRAIAATSIEDARRAIRNLLPGAYRLARAPEDDPTIIEVWT